MCRAIVRQYFDASRDELSANFWGSLVVSLTYKYESLPYAEGTIYLMRFLYEKRVVKTYFFGWVTSYNPTRNVS